MGYLVNRRYFLLFIFQVGIDLNSSFSHSHPGANRITSLRLWSGNTAMRTRTRQAGTLPDSATAWSSIALELCLRFQIVWEVTMPKCLV